MLLFKKWMDVSQSYRAFKQLVVTKVPFNSTTINKVKCVFVEGELMGPIPATFPSTLLKVLFPIETDKNGFFRMLQDMYKSGHG